MVRSSKFIFQITRSTDEVALLEVASMSIGVDGWWLVCKNRDCQQRSEKKMMRIPEQKLRLLGSSGDT